MTTETEDYSTCGVCGSDMDWVDCWQCGGEGWHDCYEDDPLWYDEGDVERCDICDGNGGWLECNCCIETAKKAQVKE